MKAIIGAGLSGLAAGKALAARGESFVIFEKSDRVGGRVQTSEVEGFRLDEGFQVGLDSYEAFSDEDGVLPLKDLEPCYFGSGAMVEVDLEGRRGWSVLANPLKHPEKLFEDLVGPVSWADRLRLIKLVGELFLQQDHQLLLAEGGSAREFLVSKGFSDEVMELFFLPFFGGVFLDEALETRVGCFLYYLKKFVKGRAFVPRGGMGKMAEVLAKSLPEGSVKLGVTVSGGKPLKSGVELNFGDGNRAVFEEVILAGDAKSTCDLLKIEPPAFRETAVVYLKSRESLYEGPWIVLPKNESEKGGQLVKHFVQVTNVDASVAPEGWHLVSATVLKGMESLSDGELGERVCFELAGMFKDTGRELEVLKVVRVKEALPDQSADQSAGYLKKVSEVKLAVPKGVRLAGDLVSNASLQNALQSGWRAGGGAC